MYPRKNIFRRLNFREITTKTTLVFIPIVKITRNLKKYEINYPQVEKGIISYNLKIQELN